jgi:transposase-like protein
LEKLAIEMYARRLSTRDIEDALIEATGDRMLSRSSVSKVTEVLYEGFEAFQGRDLSGFQVEYLFLDAIYDRLRMAYGVNEGILCAWGGSPGMVRRYCCIWPWATGRAMRTGWSFCGIWL